MKNGASSLDSEGEMDSDAVIRELLGRARSGDQAALGELLENYRGHLRILAEKLLDDRAAPRIDASDLVQQTCLSVHKQIAAFDGNDVGQFAAWLRQIHERNVRNAVRDQLRAGKRDISREERLADRDVHAIRQTTPSQHVVRNEESERLARAIAQLPDDEQEALRRRYLEGQSLAEVGTAMGLTKDALVWLMKRAMKNVKHILGEEPT
jgi:RNA polymerase sigma-70 factor (ECF subfamily)